MAISINTPSFIQQQKKLKQKQFRGKLLVVLFAFGIVLAVWVVGLEFVSTRVEAASWTKIVAGCLVFVFSVYGIKIILKIK